MAPIDLAPAAGWPALNGKSANVQVEEVNGDIDMLVVDTNLPYCANEESRKSSASSLPSSFGSHSPRPGFVPFDHNQINPVGSVQKTGIDVLVVGTGFAGLTAALECARKGHSVRMLERNSSITTVGDMYFMGLSATRFLKHWPAMKREYDSISLTNAWIQTFKHNGEEAIPPLRAADRLKAQGYDPSTPPGTFQMRPLVYQMLVRQVERLGIHIRYNRKVVDYVEDEECGKAVAITDDGYRYEADVVIAADGVGSKSQRVVGGQVTAKPSGRAMWRAAFPIEHLNENPRVKEFFKMANNGQDPIVRSWLGPNSYALTLTRPDTMIWILNHDVTGSETESWQNVVEKEEVLKGMDKMPGEPWAPIFKELVQCTPRRTIVDFKLMWRDPQPSWCSPTGRVVQIGDSAHSYLPASGNGATQAIEDAVSLASCLHIGGKKRVLQSVRAHIKMRFTRNACAQKLGFANAELLQDTDWDKVKANPRRAAPRVPRWIFDHDPEAFAYDYYDLVVDTDRKGINLEDDDRIPPNYPPGYRYSPWSIEQIMDDIRNGREVQLGEGDWS